MERMSSDRCDIRTAERLNGLQVMRALGCVGIVFAHSAAFAEMAFPGMQEGYTLNFWGRYGLLSLVTFFFAISGFLVAREVDTSEQGALTFLKKRAVRIYPTYWVGVVLAVFCSSQQGCGQALDICSGEYFYCPFGMQALF